MEIPRNILLERLEFLETGKCYPSSQRISLKSRLYSKYLKAPRISRTETDTGHVPFSEAIRLPYIPVDIGTTFGPLWTTYWFKVEFQVPSNIKELHLIWDTDSEALLYSESGRPIQAFNGGSGDDRRSSCIIENYPRDYIYYVQVSCSSMFGEGVYPEIDPGKMFSLKECRLGVFQRDVWDLMWDYQTLIECVRELKDTPRGEQALYLGNQITDVFRLNPNLVSECREIAQTFLRTQTADGEATVLAVGHCHIDTAWLWRYQETKRKVLRSWTTQLGLLNYYPNYSFCASAALHYQWLKEQSEEKFQEIQFRAEEGRWQVVGGSWVEFDGNLPCGESMARQLLYGQQFFKTHFGAYCQVFFLPDTFGYSSQLPQIISLAKMPYFVTQKLSWNLINTFPHSSFVWRGLDGTEVLTHFPPANTYCSKASLSDVLKTANNNKEKGRVDTSLLLFGLGDGGGGPLPDHLERLKRLQSLHPLPKVETGPIESLFKRMDPAKLPIWYGELYFELHRGTYTTMAIVKKLNREAEGKLRQLEIMNAVERRRPQEDISDLYKVLLQHQFHDVLPGSSIEAVYTDAVSSLRELVTRIDDLLKEQDSYGKINLQSQDLEEVIERDGQFVCVQAKAFGSVHEFDNRDEVTCIETGSDVVLENKFVRVQISNFGLVKSLVQKSSGRECFSTPGNQLVIYDDLPFYWDAWDLEIYHTRSRRVVNAPGVFTITRNDPKQCEVTWSSVLSLTSAIRQVFTLTSLSQYLMVSSEVHWEETHKVLKAEFPSTLSPSAVANYECQFGYQPRPTHWNTTWDIAKFEVTAQRWMHLGEYNFGLGLINDSKYGMNIHDGKLALTLLRSPKAPNPNADIGVHEFKYAIYPHEGQFQSSKLMAISAYLNSFCTYTIDPLDTLWVQRNSPAVVIEAIKRAEHSEDLVIRTYEALGGSVLGEITLNPAVFGNVKTVQTVDLLEETVETVTGRGNTFQQQYRPFQIISYRISFN